MIANSVAIIGAVTTMVGTIPFLSLGRFIVGIAAGVYNVTFSKMNVRGLDVLIHDQRAHG